MTIRSVVTPLLCTVALLGASSAAARTAFKVEKYNIGGDGGTDYLTAEAGTGRVFVSRGTHVMVVDGATGKVLGDIPDTPRMHGIALVPKRESRLHDERRRLDRHDVRPEDARRRSRRSRCPTGGLDGIMYDDASDRVILTNHSRPVGTVVAIDPNTGDDRRHGGARGQRARRRRGRRQGPHLRQQRRQEHDPGDRREDDEGRRVVAARAVRRPDGHRLRHGDEPDLLRLQQDVGRRRRGERQGRGDDRERRRRRRAGLGSGRRS